MKMKMPKRCAYWRGKWIFCPTLTVWKIRAYYVEVSGRLSVLYTGTVRHQGAEKQVWVYDDPNTTAWHIGEPPFCFCYVYCELIMEVE